MRFTIKFLLGYFIGTLVLFGQMPSWDVVEAMGRGINLGNTLSAPIEGNWAPEVYEQYFVDLAYEGFSNVRIPSDFFGSRTSGSTSNWSRFENTTDQYTGSIDDFSVSTTYLNRVQTIVDWSLNQGLYTIIDFHGAELKSEFLETFSDSNESYTSPTSAKRAADLMKFKSIWIQIANRFRNHPPTLLFEVVNEPYFEVSANEMNEINIMIIEAIRSTGGNNSTRKIIITGGTSTSYQAPTAISNQVIQSDSNLIASFHYYVPFSFTASSRENYNDFSWGTNADKSTVDNHFDSVRQWSETNNIPITLGEFGADNEAGLSYETGIYSSYGGPQNSSRVEYHRYLAEQAINRGFSFSAWCAGNKSTKSIHLRTDNPETNNSVPGTWVEDVKDALLADGTWPQCYGPSSDAIIRNPDFECGYSDYWDLFIPAGNNNAAQASFSETTAEVFSGTSAARVDVTVAQNYNRVLLRNVVFDGELENKTLIIGCYAKSPTPNISFKMRIKSELNGSTSSNYTPSNTFQLSNTYEYYEFDYTVPDGTSNIQLQVLLGNYIGTYFLDAFSVQVEDSSLGISSSDSPKDLVLFPNPANDYISFNCRGTIQSAKIFNSLGSLIYQSGQTSKISVGAFSKGIYFIEIRLDDGQILKDKFLKL